MSTDTSKVASSNGKTAATPSKPSKAGVVANWADERLGIAGMMKKNLRKVFPDHWSFMLGEIALWSFVVLLISGVFLTLWFKPTMAEIVYNGSYDQFRGMYVTEAFASSLDISFDIRGGLLMRQMHHWAAMLFIASMMIHLLRVYFTGAFRKPRELNWVIGCLLLILGTLEGFTGYSLPDDLLSGTGVRAADGFMKAIPVVGSYLSFLIFGGEFPGDDIITRFYIAHVLLLPGLLLALIAAHMLLLVYHKHTQWAGPGRTEEQRRRLPDAPRVRRQGRWLLLHRLRRQRPHGWPDDDQPGVEVRSVRPDQGHRGLAARLVHGLAGRRAAHHAGLGVGVLGSHPVLERLPADHRPARSDVHDPAPPAVPGGLDHR